MTAKQTLVLTDRSAWVQRWLGPKALLRRLIRRPIHAISFAVLLFVIVIAVAAPWIAPHDPTKTNLRSTHKGPSATYWLGTDEIGRDTASRLIYGARVSLQVGILAVGISHGVGIMLGLLAGFRGRIVDEAIMRVMDALFIIPSLLLALAIASVLGRTLTNVMIAIAVAGVAAPSRLVRGQVISVREHDHVIAAMAIGASGLRVALLHVLPNTLAPLIVSATLAVGRAILTEASLSFLGIGIQPPASSWGSMLQAGYRYLERNPIESFAPGIAIFLTVLAINLLGDRLREILDPRLRGSS